MFEKEAEEYAIENYETCLYDDLPYTNDSKAIEQAFKDGAEFGYNKANEWHFVKDRDLPNTETKNYTYIRRRKRYERQFTDYRVIKCFVLCLNEKGKSTAEVGYFDCNQKCFLDKAEGMVYAWKEITLPNENKKETDLNPDYFSGGW